MQTDGVGAYRGKMTVHRGVWIGISLLFVCLGLLGAVSSEHGRVPHREFFDDLMLIFVFVVFTAIALFLFVRDWLVILMLAALFLFHQFLRIGLPGNIAAPMLALIGTMFILPILRRGKAVIAVGCLVIMLSLVAFNPESAYGRPIGAIAYEVPILQTAPAIILMGVVNVFVTKQRLLEERSQALEDIESTVRTLIRANVSFQQYAHSVEERSKLEERNRITRELHDSMGYMISAFTIMIDAALQSLYEEPRKSEELLGQAREQADKTHAEIRRSLHALRSLEIASAYGTKNVLRIADAFGNATGVHVDVVLTNSASSYGGIIDAVVYRYIQEALANAFRHGKAQNVEIVFFDHGDVLQVVVRDDGTGSASIQEGIGFLGMRERLSQVDGELSYESLEHGFRLCAHIPIGPNARNT